MSPSTCHLPTSPGTSRRRLREPKGDRLAGSGAFTRALDRPDSRAKPIDFPPDPPVTRNPATLTSAVTNRRPLLWPMRLGEVGERARKDRTFGPRIRRTTTPDQTSLYQALWPQKPSRMSHQSRSEPRFRTRLDTRGGGLTGGSGVPSEARRVSKSLSGWSARVRVGSFLGLDPGATHPHPVWSAVIRW